MRGVALLLAAGVGSRFGEPKAFVDVAGMPMLARCALAIDQTELVDALVVAVPTASEVKTRAILDSLNLRLACHVVAGGTTRQESVALAYDGARAVFGVADAYVIHDVARCLVDAALFDRVLTALDTHPAAAACVPIIDTIKEVKGFEIVGTVDRDKLRAAQTPQALRADVLERGLALEGEATDDVIFAERLGESVALVAGDARNFKITTPEDLDLASARLRDSEARTSTPLNS